MNDKANNDKTETEETEEIEKEREEYKQKMREVYQKAASNTLLLLDPEELDITKDSKKSSENNKR
jgi:site-specific DNA-adenine methylase